MPKVRFLGPILTWEMITLVRRARYFGLRVVYGFVLLVVLWSVYSSVFGSYGNFAYDPIKRFEIFASQFFASFSYTQLTAVLLLTPAYVATAIAVEKDRRTIEYLFATDLSNSEIVLGKWASRALNVVMLIIVGFPVVGFSRLCGGIEMEQLIASTVLAINCALATASISIFVSIYSRNIRDALAAAYSFIFLLLISPLLAEGTAAASTHLIDALDSQHAGRVIVESLVIDPSKACAELLWMAEPYAMQAEVLSLSGKAFDEVPWFLAASCGTYGTVSLVFLGIAIARIRAVHRKAHSGTKRRLRYWLAGWRRWRTVPTVFAHPMLWKEWYFSQQRQSGCVTTIAVVAVLALLAWIINETRSLRGGFDAEDFNVFALRIMGTILVGLAYLRIAVNASSAITHEKDRDCWISLLTSPLTPNEILMAKFVGALKPLIVLLMIFAPLWCLAILNDALSPMAIPILLVVILTYGGFVASIGLHNSLRRRSTAGAIAATLIEVAFFFGLGHFLFGFLLVMLAERIWGNNSVWSIYAASLPWVVLGFAPFRTSELRHIDSELWLGIASSAVFLVIFGCIAVMLYMLTVLQFAEWTGRTENLRLPIDPTAASRWRRGSANSTSSARV